MLVADLLVLIMVSISVAIYFAPTLVAWARHHHNMAPIVVVNIFLGWTLIGWVVALAMSVSPVKPSAAPDLGPVGAPAAAGWYPDPAGSNLHRWFDGHAWSDQFQLGGG